MIGGPQIILIVIVVLLLFGGRKIPELMKGLGSGIKEFKKQLKRIKKNRILRRKTKVSSLVEGNAFQYCF